MNEMWNRLREINGKLHEIRDTYENITKRIAYGEKSDDLENDKTICEIYSALLLEEFNFLVEKIKEETENNEHLQTSKKNKQILH